LFTIKHKILVKYAIYFQKHIKKHNALLNTCNSGSKFLPGVVSCVKEACSDMLSAQAEVMMDGGDRKNRKLVSRIKGKSFFWPLSQGKNLLWLRFIGKTYWPQNYWIHHKRTDYLDIQMVKEGELLLRSDSSSFRAKKGAILIIPPGNYSLRAASPGGVQKCHLGITGKVCLHHLHEFGLDQITLLPDFFTQPVATIFDHLYEMTSSRDPACLGDYAGAIYNLLALLSNQVEISQLPPRLAAAKSFMEGNFSQPLTLDEICAHVGCSKTSLQWQFSRYMNTTPMAFLTSIRMEYAQRSLMHTGNLVKNIADQCGYSNSLYFSRVFQMHFGCSPRDFRRKNC
jgi:AraC-like DNA-binding protein